MSERSSAENAASFVAQYDRMILDPSVRSMYLGSDLYNVGDWRGGVAALPDACGALVDLHCDERSGSGARVDRVLEVGCGLGGGTSRIAAQYPGAKLVALNISLAQASYASRRHSEGSYCVGDATSLPFADQVFDRVIAVEAALHFPSRRRFLSSAHRVLRRHGRLTFTDILFTTNAWPGGWSVPRENLMWSKEQYQSACVEAGFKIEEFDDVTSHTWDGFCRHLSRAPGMNRLCEQLTAVSAQYLLIRLCKS